jgi:DNA-binding IclR family transcriptional regulator
MKMLQDREKILSALREKPLKVFEIMKRANIPNQEACQSLLLKMRDEGAVKFDIHKGQWLIGRSMSRGNLWAVQGTLPPSSRVWQGRPRPNPTKSRTGTTTVA